MENDSKFNNFELDYFIWFDANLYQVYLQRRYDSYRERTLSIKMYKYFTAKDVFKSWKDVFKDSAYCQMILESFVMKVATRCRCRLSCQFILSFLKLLSLIYGNVICNFMKVKDYSKSSILCSRSTNNIINLYLSQRAIQQPQIVNE